MLATTPDKLPTLRVVVAICNQNGIGNGGRLPWPRLKRDMQLFREVTTNCGAVKSGGSGDDGTSDGSEVNARMNAVIMGRKTWQSIPPKFRPLHNRHNIVISQTLGGSTGARIAPSFTEAVRQAVSIPNVGHICIIGGSSVYEAAFKSPHPIRLYLTRVHAEFECDTFLSGLDLGQFVEVDGDDDVDIPRETIKEAEVEYDFHVYIRD